MGQLNLAGKLEVTGDDSINVNGDLVLTANSIIRATQDVNVAGSIDGGFSLELSAENGDVSLAFNTGGGQALSSFNAEGKNVSVKSVIAQNDILIAAGNTVV